MTTVVPSLSTAGFITDLPTQIDKVMSYYLTSDFSQSNLFRGQIVSLQKQIQAYQHDKMLLNERVREELEGLLTEVADSASVNVSSETPNPEDPGRINLTVAAVVTKDGKAYSVGKLIETRDSVTQKIFNLNNDGTRL